MSRGPPGLLQGPEAQVGQLPGLGDTDRFQVDPSGAGGPVQPDAVAEQDGQGQ
jgi:hypothetical protein